MNNLEDFIREEFELRLSRSGVSYDQDSDISKLIERCNKYSPIAKWREAGMLIYIASMRYEEYEESLKCPF